MKKSYWNREVSTCHPWQSGSWAYRWMHSDSIEGNARFFLCSQIVLRHSFPAFDVMLVQHIAIQHRFTKENRNNQENQDGYNVGKNFFNQVVFHSLVFYKRNDTGRRFHFQGDKIMLFYTKFTHALAIIFVKTGFYMWVLFSSFPGISAIEKIKSWSRLFHSDHYWICNRVAGCSSYIDFLPCCVDKI